MRELAILQAMDGCRVNLRQLSELGDGQVHVGDALGQRHTPEDIAKVRHEVKDAYRKCSISLSVSQGCDTPNVDPPEEKPWNGARLTMLREQRGMLKNHVAVLLGVHQTDVNRWEKARGSTGSPRSSMLWVLCRTFGVPPGYFFLSDDEDEAGLLEEVADYSRGMVSLLEARSGGRGSKREQGSPTDLVPDPDSKSGGMIERRLLKKAAAVSGSKAHPPSSRPAR